MTPFLKVTTVSPNPEVQDNPITLLLPLSRIGSVFYDTQLPQKRVYIEDAFKLHNVEPGRVGTGWFIRESMEEIEKKLATLTRTQ